ncbi:LPP20 family lipoprotein [Lysobacter sp. N42]|uniref:LPP20 family lipoprotein n=2 Tax=Gammaproteobacteria TaxID=1236 RepID=UPI000DCFF5CC|nr:LPP20 family lipoprotein [Lysobacter sp. N42]RTE86778.1 flagellar biosynthesis protein FlgP [Aliidiomarina sp. B3213]TCZ91522.1 flagellar biosynthesis protein FlgP [Lysobacter sp. N42]
MKLGRKKTLQTLVGGVALSLMVGCSSMTRHVEYTTETPDDFPVVTATGYAPVANQQSDNEQERILLAIRASRLEAYRELAEQIQGVYLDGQTQVSDMLIESDSFRTQVSGLIRGAEVVRSYPVGEYYATELRIDFERVHNLYISTSRPQRVRNVIYY